MDDMPGLAFRPYDDELVGYYLPHKILGNTHLAEKFIAEVNFYEFDPWVLRLQSKVISRDLVWYFFSRREKKYASGTQQSRTTPHGKWKVTGKPADVKDPRKLWCQVRGGTIGFKRFLGFTKNNSEKGTKSEWVMQEFHCTLFPELEETYVICRMEYNGDDVNILSYDPTILTPAFIPNMTHSTGSGSVVDQPLQAYSGSYNTHPENDSANQVQQFGDNFHMDQPFQGNLGVFNNPFEFGSGYQGHLFSSSLYDGETQMIWNDDIPKDNEFVGDEMSYTLVNQSNHRPRNPVTGIIAGYSSDSDTDSLNGRDTSSSTGSVGSSNGSWRTPRDDTLSLSTIKPIQQPPEQLKSHLQDKEKVIDTQKSEPEWKRAEDPVMKAPSTVPVKQSWIVLEEMSQRKSQWNYLKNMIIGVLVLISIIGWIILVG